MPDRISTLVERLFAGTSWRAFLVASLLLTYFLLAVSSQLDKCATFDEVACLTSGYSAWINGDFRLQPENGTLEQRWAALPLLFDKPRFPSLSQPAWEIGAAPAIGHQFFYDSGNDADRMLLHGRAMVALMGTALAGVVFWSACRLFGFTGGLLSLVLFTFCPTMLAHGSLTTSDLAAASFFTGGAVCLWGVLERVTVWRVAASSLSIAALFLAKYSAVLMLPIALALAVLRLLDGRPLHVQVGRAWLVRRRWSQALVLTAVALIEVAIIWGAIWAAFGLRYEAMARQEPGQDHLLPQWQTLPPIPGGLGRMVELSQEYRVLPEAYLFGFVHTARMTSGRVSFLNGEYRTTGSVWFFPYCLLVKTPPALFGLLGLAGAAVIFRWRSAQEGAPGRLRSRCWSSIYAAAPFWTLLLVYWTAVLGSRLNIGHRHLLPTYPAMFVLAGAAGFWLEKRATQAQSKPVRWPQAGLFASAGLLLVLFVADSLSAWPNYLSYFNWAAGGPMNAYRHLVDSSLDWGQDLPGLAKWLHRRGSSKAAGSGIYLSYFGTASPEYYGIDAIRLPCFFDRPYTTLPTPLAGGVYCISATMLQGVYLETPERWNARYEASYRQLSRFLEELKTHRRDSAAVRALFARAGNPDPIKVFRRFEHLRFARLCAFLRQRKPDDQVGFSILIYRLSDRDIDLALKGEVSVHE